MLHKRIFKVLSAAALICAFGFTTAFANDGFLQNGGNEYDFNEYEGGLADKMFKGTPDFLHEKEIDAKHGISMALTERLGTAAPWAEYYFDRDVLIDNSCEFQLETEFYVTSGIKKGGCSIMLDGTSKVTIVQISTAYKLIINNVNSVNKSFSVEPDTWYKLYMKSDIANSKISIRVQKSDGEIVAEEEANLPAAYQTIKGVRFVGPYVAENNSPDVYFALDNFKLSYLYKLPVVTDIKSDGADDNGKIDFKAQSIMVTFDYPLYYESLSTENVFLKNKFGKIDVKSVSGSENTVSLALSVPLESATDYEVVFDKSVQIQKDISINEPISVSFATTEDVLELSDFAFTKKSDKIELKINIANNSSESESFCVIAAVLNGNKVIKTIAFDSVVEKDGNKYDLPLISDGEYIKVYVLDNYDSSLLISKEPLIY